ncbi:uncharacterized protein LOC133875292 isoform X4 [Alnus glutinosa]|uniref:uncharacterized protein LOC133875292 isoform X4 n=1 Tax=Alnus glutinosa TaxID=3517 RepID=UPI002D79F2FF|nr:uncharacterized protein LOC133875292 isoform X4 [Alnus glutinosa]
MAVRISVEKLDLNSNSKSSRKLTTLQSSVAGLPKKTKPPTLFSLCLGVVGKHLEDIIEDLGEIAINFPADTKMAIAAIARRRRLLNDEVIISLADSSWEVLDISGSDVSDLGLVKVVETCKFLRAVDIRGSPRSDYTARRCLGLFKPKLIDADGDSWEELDAAEIANGAGSLRWLVWPKIDKDSLEILSTECPRIMVNPKPSSPFCFRGDAVPREALPNITLDDPVVKDIDPTTWAVCGFNPKTLSSPSLSSRPELSVAEKFRLAFVERDTRLAPKRAKNARQHQRRAEREWMMTDTRAKAVALASQTSKSLHSWN